MMGGEGSLSGTLLAVLIVTTIYNGMQLPNIYLGLAIGCNGDRFTLLDNCQ
jgi:ribose/xylose/arabinose/galactoside ABC-type transport system permease subunit